MCPTPGTQYVLYIQYREEPGDLQDFVDLESDVQEAIRNRVQRLRDQVERQKRG
jgi:hypothetical protein